MSEDKSQKQSDLEKKLIDTAPEQGRRRLLKKSVAIPIIMTLNSGAAAQVARTSNLVSAAEDNPYMVGDQIACFDVEQIHDMDGHTKYDLGDTISYTLEDDVNACSSRSDAFGPGIVISSAAYSSISGRPGVIITERII